MALTIDKIFCILLAHFGKQNWWPAETPFEVIVGAILTQNTSWKNVEKSISSIKEQGLMSPERLYALNETTLAELIKSSGFYNLKAKRLKNFLNFFAGYNFDLNQLRDDTQIRDKLLKIKGIGRETADSILLYALNLPYFVVDAYTKRIFFRLGFLKSEDVDYDEVQQLFTQNLPEDVELFKEYHALIVETAKNYCKKRPCCNNCPLSSMCNHSKLAKPKQRDIVTSAVS